MRISDWSSDVCSSDLADMDVALERLFAARIRLGMFDPPERVPFSTIPISENHSAAHQQLALRAARESIVLLKNDGLLPLDKTDATIAVIGPSATSLIALEGNYNGTPTAPVRPIAAMDTVFGADSVNYAKGEVFVGELAE